MQINKIEYSIDNSTYVKFDGLTYPMSLYNKFNEELDSGEFNLNATIKSFPYEPFTKVKITFEDASIKYFYIDTDYVTETAANSARYNHFITIVEPTKILERIIIPNRGFTQPLIYANWLTIEEVIQDILDTAKTLTKAERDLGGIIDIIIDPSISAFLEVKSPEFTFKQMTLWDALSTIGKFIYAIPRMTDFNTLTFDFLAQTNEIAYSQPYHAQSRNHLGNNYASSISTDFNNLIANNNDDEASIIFPWKGGWITPRANPYSGSIVEDNALLYLPFPIYKIVKLSASYFTVKNTGAGNFQYADHPVDITKWVYEERAYKALPNTASEKGTALYYTEGKNTIENFQYKDPTWFLGGTWTDRSIEEVLIAGMNEYYSTTAFDKLETQISNVSFQIEYVPYLAGTLKSYKRPGLKTPSSLFYNNPEATVDGQSLGADTQTKILRMGNIDITKGYTLKTTDEPIKPGDIDANTNGYFVAANKLTFHPDKVELEAQFTKDFGKISEFVGLDSRRRSWDLPDADLVQRTINIDEFIHVFDMEPDTPSNIRLTTEGFNNYMDVFQLNYISESQQAEVMYHRYQSFGGAFTTHYVETPIVSFGFGNSIVFQSKIEDNASIGFRNLHGTTEQEAVQIGGEEEYVEVYFAQRGPQGNDLYLDPGYSNADNDDFAIPVREVGDNLPQVLPGNTPIDAAIIPSILWQSKGFAEKLIVNKRGREVLNYIYQLHTRSTSHKIIIGEALSRYNPLVSEFAGDITLKTVGLDYELGPFDKVVDLTRGVNLGGNIVVNKPIDPNSGAYEMYAQSITNSVTRKSWAIVRSDTNEILIGYNEEFLAPAQLTSLWFTSHRSEIQEYQEEVITPDSITLSAPEFALIGETFQATYILNPIDASASVLWSLDQGNGILDQSGNYTGYSIETAILRITTDNGKTDTAAVEIVESLPPEGVTSITIIGPSSGFVLQTLDYSYLVSPANEPTTVVWQLISGSGIFTPGSPSANQARYVAFEAETATIKITTGNGKSDTHTITIT